MAMPNPTSSEETVLILAPTGRDATLASKALSLAGVHGEVCRDMNDLCQRIGAGAGMALITDEALAEGRAITLLQQTLGRAPAWSDLPLIILTTDEPERGAAPHDAAPLATLGNVTFLERPIRVQTLVTSVTSALRARRRQYEVRDLLVQQETAVERLDLLAEVASHLLLSDEPEGIVASVFAKIAAHLGLEVYLCYLFDERKQKLHLSSQAGLPAHLAAQWEWLDFSSFCGSVAQRQKRIIAQQVQLSNESATADIKALGLKAYACFPLLANGRLIGTLSFGVRARDRLEHEELAMLETVCHQVAVAIQRKRTEEELQALNQRLESRVEERTSQLREINDQMEAFSYSISHDLRAPLRAIRGFAQALGEDYGSALDETGRDFLRRMSEGAERLDRLIQDLLQYSRLSRSTLTFEPMDMGATVQRVLLQLDAEISASGALVEVEPGLEGMLGHEPTMEQVLINLLSNAIKFVAPGVQPHIRIWSTQSNGSARLWVADNGIGILSAHHQRIFGVFERLHSIEAYPGTGIGLAIVAKGIARMGGTVGLESEEGQGSRFWIELPRATGADHRDHQADANSESALLHD